MASTHENPTNPTGRRTNHRVFRKRREGHHPTLAFPDRFKDLRDDTEEDVLPPSQGSQMFMNLNQSIFGLIAAAGSNVDFNDRFEGQSSDEDDTPGNDSNEDHRHADRPGRRDLHERVTKTTILKPRSSGKEDGITDEKQERRASGHLLRSLPQLPRFATRSFSNRNRSRRLRSSNTSGRNMGTVLASPVEEASDVEPGLADRAIRPEPVLSRMLEARAEMSSRPSFDLEGPSNEQATKAGEAGSGGLAQKLKDIFGFDEVEEVIDEYPCWLLQSALLQGYLYITSKHVCFYAYLPKRSQEVIKSGFLAKSGKRNPTYSRYWFRLKGDVLAYYADSVDLYFPHGQIDLRYAISASITDKEKDAVHFSVITDHRTYYFKADSAPSAKDWVNNLQRVIFRSHNDGDSVKISLPIENILDVEESQIIEFADTCKLRVIDNDDTFSMDEYFFSFFNFGKEAIDTLKGLIDEPSRNSGEAKDTNPLAEEARTPRIHESVRVTLSPLSPRHRPTSSSRTSHDGEEHAHHSRRNHGFPSPSRESNARRSFSGHRSPERSSTSQENDDSFVQSLDDPSISGMVESSVEDPSGSQILRGSEVFRRPTIHHSTSSSRSSGETRGLERESGRGLQRDSSQQTLHAMPTSDSGKAQQASTPALQGLTKMGSYPLQRAGALASFLNHTGRRMSNLLATESMGYVEKVSGMWKGGRKHYSTAPGLTIGEDEDYAREETDENHVSANERFREHFALPDTEQLQATYFGFLNRVLPLYGKVYISDRYFCFRSLLPGTRTKLILPIKDIETADKEKGFRFRYYGLVIVIRGHEELFFEFHQADVRDDCAITVLRKLDAARHERETGSLDGDESEGKNEALAERDALDEARLNEGTEHNLKMPQNTSDLAKSTPTILFDDTKASFINFKPTEPMKITCLTIGSRGDVQPYIALCKGLLADGHKPRIATHTEFREWIEGHGIEFAPVDGDPSELMRICIQNGTFTWAFLREANSKFRGWLDGLLESAYSACQGSDLLIESPSAMAGIHISEALNIPYFRAFTMPWTRTRAYPHAFVMPEHKMGGAYNYFTYLMFDNVFWKATAHQVNRWRNKVLGLPNTNLEKMQPNKVPFLYNFSPAVVAPPLDYSDWIRVTGYWFLDEGPVWTPPDDLRRFIEKARKDNKKLVYVGFGSIIVPDPAKMTQEVIDGVMKADVRCILSKGWSDRLDKTHASVPEEAFPPEIFQIKSAPHDWLFRQIDAAAHHGGSGTTGASLRAGVPTIIRPFFGDQFFFGSRVEDLGVGICLKKWGANSFAKALWEATHSERMIVKARILGETIRKEDGVNTAIQSIYRDLEYAKSLVAAKAGKNAATVGSTDGANAGDESEEESWTFVGDDLDPELIVKKSTLTEMEAKRASGSGFTARHGGADTPVMATP